MKEQVYTGIDGKRIVVKTPETKQDVDELLNRRTPGPRVFESNPEPSGGVKDALQKLFTRFGKS